MVDIHQGGGGWGGRDSGGIQSEKRRVDGRKFGDTEGQGDTRGRGKRGEMAADGTGTPTEGTMTVNPSPVHRSEPEPFLPDETLSGSKKGKRASAAGKLKKGLAGEKYSCARLRGDV